MKKTIKLDRAMLRGLINEAIMAKPFGQPEGIWVNEADEHETDASDVVQQMAEVAKQFWIDTFSEGDPSQQEAGLESWNEQCERAAEELVQRLLGPFSDVEDRLIDGEFYEGPQHQFDEMDESDDELPPMHPRGGGTGFSGGGQGVGSNASSSTGTLPKSGTKSGTQDDLPPTHPRGRR